MPAVDEAPEDSSVIDWDFPHPFCWRVQVPESDIDRLGHVNNVAYLRYLEAAAWAHSESLGLDWPVYERLNCAVVAHRHEIDYLQPAFAGEELVVGTWCTANDGKLRLQRHYQLVRPADRRTLVRGVTQWVSIDLTTGRPRRMPPEFVAGFRVTCLPSPSSGRF